MMNAKNPLFIADRARVFVPWMVLVLVFVGLLSISVGLFAFSVLDHWEGAISGSMTVQVTQGGSNSLAQDTATAVGILEASPLVKSVRALPREEMHELLKPWIGEAFALDSLPLPALLDVQLSSSGHTEDQLKALEKQLKEKVHNASSELHFRWLERLRVIKTSFVSVMALIIVMIVASLAGAIMYASITGLGMHQETIFLLHQMGAKDSYIAKQFARRFSYLSGVGALAGLAASVPVVMLLQKLARNLNSGLISFSGFSAIDWLVLVSSAGAAVGLSAAASYLAVRNRLERIL